MKQDDKVISIAIILMFILIVSLNSCSVDLPFEREDLRDAYHLLENASNRLGSISESLEKIAEEGNCAIKNQ